MSNRSDFKYDEFFHTLKHKRYTNHVNKLGIVECSLSKIEESIPIISLVNLTICTTDGIKLLNMSFGKKYDTERLISIATKYGQLRQDKINFVFHKIYKEDEKIIFLYKTNVIFIGIFSYETRSVFIKSYMIHMYISFVNFNGEIMNIGKKTFNIDSANSNNKSLDYAKNEYFQLRVYDLFFIKHITSHFERVFQYIIKKEEIYLSNIKFKNMYIIDLSTNMIIFDLLCMRVKII
jgi:hypothetical protein